LQKSQGEGIRVELEDEDAGTSFWNGSCKNVAEEIDESTCQKYKSQTIIKSQQVNTNKSQENKQTKINQNKIIINKQIIKK
jgi:hypothetical protein